MKKSIVDSLGLDSSNNSHSFISILDRELTISKSREEWSLLEIDWKLALKKKKSYLVIGKSKKGSFWWLNSLYF